MSKRFEFRLNGNFFGDISEKLKEEGFQNGGDSFVGKGSFVYCQVYTSRTRRALTAIKNFWTGLNDNWFEPGKKYASPLRTRVIIWTDSKEEGNRLYNLVKDTTKNEGFFATAYNCL
jgi:hypothetical protein